MTYTTTDYHICITSSIIHSLIPSLTGSLTSFLPSLVLLPHSFPHLYLIHLSCNGLFWTFTPALQAPTFPPFTPSLTLSPSIPSHHSLTLSLTPSLTPFPHPQHPVHSHALSPTPVLCLLLYPEFPFHMSIFFHKYSPSLGCMRKLTPDLISSVPLS